MEVDYISPARISFSRGQITWLLKSLVEMREGHYPTDPAGCTIPIFGGSKRAPFITPIEVAAELTARLDACGRDGLMVECFFCLDKDHWILAKAFGMSPEVVGKRLDSVLDYIVSPRGSDGGRQNRTYEEFRQHKPGGDELKLRDAPDAQPIPQEGRQLK